MHTAADAGLHHALYFSVTYTVHLLVWDLLSNLPIATD